MAGLFIMTSLTCPALASLEVEAAEGPLDLRQEAVLKTPQVYPKKFIYDDGVDIPYPEEGIKGAFLPLSSGNTIHTDSLLSRIENNNLNTVVAILKNNNGDVLLELLLADQSPEVTDSEPDQTNSNESEVEEEEETPLFDFESDILNSLAHQIDSQSQDLISRLEESQTYPIARISVFKDSNLAENRPDLSYTYEDGSIYYDSEGQAYTNPFIQEVWDYNIELAITAAKVGFKEIQFDGLVFPEEFPQDIEGLIYNSGQENDSDQDAHQQLFQASSDFLAYAQEELIPYGVDISISLPAHRLASTSEDYEQEYFSRLAETADTLSAEIFPSEFPPDSMGINQPDLAPYEVADSYLTFEKDFLDSLENPPESRPWLQDYTAIYLGEGNYQYYGTEEVEDQLRALEEHEIQEYLLWNPEGNYSDLTQMSDENDNNDQ